MIAGTLRVAAAATVDEFRRVPPWVSFGLVLAVAVACAQWPGRAPYDASFANLAGPLIPYLALRALLSGGSWAAATVAARRYGAHGRAWVFAQVAVVGVVVALWMAITHGALLYFPTQDAYRAVLGGTEMGLLASVAVACAYTFGFSVASVWGERGRLGYWVGDLLLAGSSGFWVLPFPRAYLPGMLGGPSPLDIGLVGSWCGLALISVICVATLLVKVEE